MISPKYILSLFCIGLVSIQLPVFADNVSDMKDMVNNSITKLIQSYELRIKNLETENSALKQEIVNLKGTTTTGTNLTTTIIPTVTAPIVVAQISTATGTKSDIYNSVIKQANANLGAILSENTLPAYSAIGLFEFIEPNAVFISLDDGNNPAGVTAFKTKILYTFDTNGVFTKIGIFDLDYASQKYRTLLGTNPFAKSARTRVPNAGYKGKLFDAIVATSTGTTTSSGIITPSLPVTTEVTVAQIKAAYDKTKLLDAIKLSDTFIVNTPNNIEVLRIRYRSYYIIGKYDNSLSEIKKIEELQASAFERTIACDAAVIGKIAKKPDISTYYSAICKKK